VKLAAPHSLAAALLCLSLPCEAEPSSVRWETGGEVAGYADSDSVWVVTPSARAQAREATVGWSASGGYLVDVVSAASVDIVSTASPRWFEIRHAGNLSAGYKPGSTGGSLSLATSVEPDYTSVAAGVGATHELSRRNVTLSLGYGFEHDVAGRTDTPFSVYALRLDRHELRAGAEIVVGAGTLLSATLDAQLERGRQEKPYRWLPLFDAGVASSVPVGASVSSVNSLRLPGRVSERVPDSRERWAGTARLAHRFSSSTLVLWDRVYLDSWGLLASTTDVKWTVDLTRRFSVWPRARFHDQTGVSFWRRAYVGSVGAGSVVVPEHRTGDRELSPLWTLTGGGGAAADLGGAEPRSFSVSLELEASYTDFRDALYLERRWSAFGVAGFTARFQ
jgi:hypothetical protein